jgi:hypothetical protein
MVTYIASETTTSNASTAMPAASALAPAWTATHCRPRCASWATRNTARRRGHAFPNRTPARPTVVSSVPDSIATATNVPAEEA